MRPRPTPSSRADQVLPPLAPAEREIGRLAAHAAGDEGEQRGVLVVRMGRDDQQPLVGRELGERPVDGGDAARWKRGSRGDGEGVCGSSWAGSEAGEEKEDQDGKRLRESSRHSQGSRDRNRPAGADRPASPALTCPPRAQREAPVHPLT